MGGPGSGRKKGSTRKTNQLVSHAGKTWRVVGNESKYNKGNVHIATVIGGKTVIKNVPNSSVRKSRAKYS